MLRTENFGDPHLVSSLSEATTNGHAKIVIHSTDPLKSD
jgi:hypothetical protein